MESQLNSILAYSASILAAAFLFILSILYEFINAMELVFFIAIILWLASFGFAIGELNKSKIIGAGMIVVTLVLGVIGGFTFFILLAASSM